MPSLPPCLSRLARASEVSLGRVGVAAVLSDEAAAFEEAAQLGAALRPELVWLAQHATVAGRMYAALLLEPFDHAAALITWRELLTVHEWVRVAPGGCMVMNAWASDYARSMIDTGILGAFRETDEDRAWREAHPRNDQRRVPSQSSFARARERITSGPWVVLIPIAWVGVAVGLPYLLQWLLRR